MLLFSLVCLHKNKTGREGLLLHKTKNRFQESLISLRNVKRQPKLASVIWYIRKVGDLFRKALYCASDECESVCITEPEYTAQVEMKC